MMENNAAFTWDDSERGGFKMEYFPPVDVPIIPHTPWVLKNIPIPPGVFSEVCKIIRVCSVSIPRNENENKNKFNGIRTVLAVAKLSNTVMQCLSVNL